MVEYGEKKGGKGKGVVVDGISGGWMTEAGQSEWGMVGGWAFLTVELMRFINHSMIMTINFKRNPRPQKITFSNINRNCPSTSIIHID